VEIATIKTDALDQCPQRLVLGDCLQSFVTLPIELHIDRLEQKWFGIILELSGYQPHIFQILSWDPFENLDDDFWRHAIQTCQRHRES